MASQRFEAELEQEKAEEDKILLEASQRFEGS